MKSRYRNEFIFTNSTKIFKSKEVFSIKEIHNWLITHTPEYHKIKEYSPKCNICLVKISDEYYKYHYPHCRCENFEKTPEYQFCELYEYLLFVWKFQRQNIKEKFREFKDIYTSKDKAKLKEWYFKNESIISDFLCDAGYIFDYNRDDKKILIYNNDFNSEEDKVEIYIKKGDFKHTIEFLRLFEEEIDYPLGECNKKIFVEPISEEKLFKSKYENITIPSLKKLFEKRRYSFKELQEWLEENKALATQARENYEKYVDFCSYKLSTTKNFKPLFSFEDDSFLLIVFPLLCNNLYELIAFTEFANVQLAKIKNSKDIDFNYLSSEIKNFCIDKTEKLKKITEQIKKIGEYDILRYGEIAIQANINELNPILELMKVFTENHHYCHKPIYSTQEILNGVLKAFLCKDMTRILPYLISLNCKLTYYKVDFYKKLRIYFNDNEIKNIESWKFKTYAIFSTEDDTKHFKYEFFCPKEQKIFLYLEVVIKADTICFDLA